MGKTWKTTVHDIVQVDQSTFDFPHNTQWFQTYQDMEPSKVTPVTYSPEMNEDFLDQNSPGGFPRRFIGKPKGEWSSTEGEANKTLIDMLRRRNAILDILTRDITAITKRYALYVNGIAYPAVRTLTRAKAMKILRERFPQALTSGNYRIVEEEFKTSTLNKNAGSYSSTYTDEQGEQFYNEQHMDNVDEEPYVNHQERDYPFGYWDAPQNTATDFPWAKDLETYKVRLDLLPKPFNRPNPWNMTEYNVTYYDSMPASDGIEASNPE